MSEHTCAMPSVWGSPSTDILADLQRAAEAIRERHRSPLPNIWVRTVPSSLLPYKAPRLERERFSGGVNLSAQARNAALVAAAREEQELTFLRMGDSLFCSERGKAELAKRVATDLRDTNALGAFFARPTAYELPSFELPAFEEPPRPSVYGVRYPVNADLFNKLQVF